MPRPNRLAGPVRDTVPVCLTTDDRDLLAQTGLSDAEILRRGIQSFAREYQVTSPMLRFASERDAEGKRADIARTHDDALVNSYRVLPSMKRR
jgi:hypothetical protein